MSHNMTPYKPQHRESLLSKLWRLGLKVPDFWPNRPDSWFVQLETQFSIFNIHEDIPRFNYLIVLLGDTYTAEFQYIITLPPRLNKYETLKSAVIAHYSELQTNKIKKWLDEDIGDRKPSEYLHHLKNMANMSVPDKYIRIIWSTRLPCHIQTAILPLADLPLEKVVEVADEIYGYGQSAPRGPKEPRMDKKYHKLAALTYNEINAQALPYNMPSTSKQSNFSGNFGGSRQ